MLFRVNRFSGRLGNYLSLCSSLALVLAGLNAWGQITFTDVTSESGIDHQFRVYEGLFGGGVCVLDFNKDGREDLYLAGGLNEDRLYRNDGNGRFTNVYQNSGLDASSRFVTQGAASADVNRDGWPDIFITTITTKDSIRIIPRAENLLFINNGDGTFYDATEAYGLKELVSFSTGASFGDFDADGFPDLYVSNYFYDYEGKLGKMTDATIVNANLTSVGYLFHNRKGRSFENVYGDYKLKHKGFGFGSVFTDYDNDSDADLLIINDFGYKATPNLLLQNNYPRGSFSDVSEAQGMDLKINAMGTAIGDYDNNGLMDYYVTNIRFNRFMVNSGTETGFADKAKELGMGYVTISWGANFADFDNDTDLDLFVANGDLNPNDVPQANFYFENTAGHFKERAYEIGLNDYGVGRGSVVFDMDNDGDLDILVVNQVPVLSYPVPSETKLYRNDCKQGNWLKVSLKGVEADLNGLGSRVEVVVGKVKMIREIDGGSSHLSQGSPIAHFGLGDALMADSVIVKWLGGNKQVLTDQRANSMITVVEVPGKGWKPSPTILAAVSFLLVTVAVLGLLKLKRTG